MTETPEWDSNDIAEHFKGVSTVEMLRVARLTLHPIDAHRWVATYPGRMWRYANGDWTATTDHDDPTGDHCYDEDFFRYLLGEQLIDQGATRQTISWHHY